MWEYKYPDELYHHGIKGMKWGRRKPRNISESHSMISDYAKKKL